MQKCFIGYGHKFHSGDKISRIKLYMCVAYFQGYIFAVHLLLVDLYMLLLAPLAKYKVMLHSMPCCLASN